MLTFTRLREVNTTRCGDAFHSIERWSPTDWACAVAGEAGEACNLIKKLRRLDDADSDKDTPAYREQLRKLIAEELADTIIYIDLLAARLDIDLAIHVIQKFNEVSDKRGSSVKL